MGTCTASECVRVWVRQQSPPFAVLGSVLPRSDYPALATIAYLNQASLGMMGQPAVTAFHSFIADVGRHGNLFMSDADEVSYFDRLRRAGAAVLGTTSPHVAITGGVSELLGQLPYLLPIRPEQNVVLVSSDFPAVTRSWLGMQQRGGCRIRFVQDDARRDLTDSLCEAVDPLTAVVAVSYVQYATGRLVGRLPGRRPLARP